MLETCTFQSTVPQERVEALHSSDFMTRVMQRTPLMLLTEEFMMGETYGYKWPNIDDLLLREEVDMVVVAVGQDPGIDVDAHAHAPDPGEGDQNHATKGQDLKIKEDHEIEGVTIKNQDPNPEDAKTDHDQILGTRDQDQPRRRKDPGQDL